MKLTTWRRLHARARASLSLLTPLRHLLHSHTALSTAESGYKTYLQSKTVNWNLENALREHKGVTLQQRFRPTVLLRVEMKKRASGSDCGPYKIRVHAPATSATHTYIFDFTTFLDFLLDVKPETAERRRFKL